MTLYNVKLDQDEEDRKGPRTTVVAAPAKVAAAPASVSEQALIVSVDAVQPGRLDASGTRRTTQLPGFDGQRVFDIVASLALLVMLAPLMLLVGLLVVLNDGGPALFRHRRVGQGGKAFSCLKFRSMSVDAEARLKSLLENNPSLKREWEQNQKLENDPRVTRLGRFLRLSSLDELPQLINVLRGDMTLVGPRPIVTSELSQYGRFASYYLSVKPGLTGLWQVSGRSNTSYRRRVAADILYVRSRSIPLDIFILLMTVPAVLSGRGSC